VTPVHSLQCFRDDTSFTTVVCHRVDLRSVGVDMINSTKRLILAARTVFTYAKRSNCQSTIPSCNATSCHIEQGQPFLQSSHPLHVASLSLCWCDCDWNAREVICMTSRNLGNPMFCLSSASTMLRYSIPSSWLQSAVHDRGHTVDRGICLVWSPDGARRTLGGF
jgi:hypothetical protein